MTEVEVLVRVFDDKETVLNKLSKYKFIGESSVLDIYYYDELRSNLKPIDNKIYECFRTREKNNKNYLTYKVDKYSSDGKWLYSEENETIIEDAIVMKKIIANLGLKELIRVKTVKLIFLYGNYEIVLEEEETLGLFLEVEYKGEILTDELKIKKEIQEFIDSLSIKVSEELNSGKPELLLNLKK